MTNGQILEDTYLKIIKSGEIPYQANRRATQAIDVFRDDVMGRVEVQTLIDGIDDFIRNLEDFRNVAQDILRKAH